MSAVRGLLGRWRGKRRPKPVGLGHWSPRHPAPREVIAVIHYRRGTVRWEIPMLHMSGSPCSSRYEAQAAAYVHASAVVPGVGVIFTGCPGGRKCWLSSCGQ